MQKEVKDYIRLKDILLILNYEPLLKTNQEIFYETDKIHIKAFCNIICFVFWLYFYHPK